eukprot:scaffold8029_cov170-Amphora_coffeaeformis.AAC.4
MKGVCRLGRILIAYGSHPCPKFETRIPINVAAWNVEMPMPRIEERQSLYVVLPYRQSYQYLKFSHTGLSLVRSNANVII